MPTFEISTPDGAKYEITAPNEAMAVAAIKQQSASTQPAAPAAEPAPKPDKYQQAAVDEAKSNPAIDRQASLTRQLVHGATLGADNTIMAGVATPFEMIKHGTWDPREGYSYAKAREDRQLDEARKNNGLLGTGAEVVGGGVTGGGLAKAGVTAGRFLGEGAGLLKRALASGADGLGLGAVSGAMEGNGLEERASNAVKGAVGGGAIGAGLPFGFGIAGKVLSPIASNVRARMNPTEYANRQFARGVTESGRSADDIALDVIQAANEGQGVYNVADGMGNAGQRLLSTAARGPGQGRTAIVEALDRRQADQGRRIAGTLSEGFDNPATAAQTETRMTRARDAAADTEYSAVRTDAGRVDVVPAMNNLDRNIGTGGGQNLTAANDSIEAILTPFRQRLARVNPDDFEAVQRIRADMADVAQNARQNGYGNRARLIGQAVRELDSSMEGASPGYQQANQNFAKSSRDIEAVQTGRDAARRGRTEDIVPEFQGLSPEGQQAYRAGYVDPLIESAQGAPYGANKARPLTSDSFHDEAAVIAPQNGMMQRRLGRENTMFETRRQATGNSKTAENLADDAAMAASPEFIGFVGHVLSGNIPAAARAVFHAGSNVWTGNTPAVRQAVADILLQRGGNMRPDTLRVLVDQTVARMENAQNLARGLAHGATSGLAVASPGMARKTKH
jgi:hypothetical protein